MDGETLHRVARARAEELPGTACEQPFGPGADVFKVAGKMFLLLADRGEGHISVKVDPADATVLRAMHPQILEGYHLNKRHWVSIMADGGGGEVDTPGEVGPADPLDEGLVRDLVTESYLLVVAGLPRRSRPVDPETFGRPSAREH